MESKTLGIYPIDLHILQSQAYLEQMVYPDSSREYYWSTDFSAAFYIAQAKAGFMAICETIEDEELLLPEMQRSYALLDFRDLHVSKKVSRLLEKHQPTLHISTCLDEVACAIAQHHKNSWLTPRYLQTLKSTQNQDPNFKAISVILKDGEVMVAGEIGYIIGRTYTSLSGFSSRQKQYRDWGKAQMVLLAQTLQREGFAFWNLGHPYMPYKTALGAKIYPREAFLKRWFC
jgi:Leu/Phe-tRNA-protein transferase